MNFFGIPIVINDKNGYYSPANNSFHISDKMNKIFSRFKEIYNEEPTYINKHNKTYFHPYLFSAMIGYNNIDYLLKISKKIYDIHKQENDLNDSIEVDEPIITKRDLNEEDNKRDVKNISSYSLGRIGENIVLNTLKTINPSVYDVNMVSSTGHVGDIHVTDKNNMLKYLIEVKEKGVITKDDLTKFDKDIEQLKNTNGLLYKRIIGIFISLESNVIPSIGRYKITADKIYLSKEMFSKDSMVIIFSMFETACYLNESTKNMVKYDIPIKVYELISRLRIEYNTIINEEDIYKSMITNCENNLLSLSTLQRNNLIKKDFIKFINNEFSNILPIIDNNLNTKEEERLKEYIKTHKRKDLLKKTLINEFPSYVTEISSMKLNDFINKYK